jgi:hypothetical protein
MYHKLTAILYRKSSSISAATFHHFEENASLIVSLAANVAPLARTGEHMDSNLSHYMIIVE